MLFYQCCAGAIKLPTPLLMPRNRKLYEHNEASYFMDHSGMLVMLPYDLRVSCVLYILSWVWEIFCVVFFDLRIKIFGTGVPFYLPVTRDLAMQVPSYLPLDTVFPL